MINTFKSFGFIIHQQYYYEEFPVLGEPTNYSMYDMNLSLNKGGLQEYLPVDKGTWIYLVNNAQSPWAYCAILGDVGFRLRRVRKPTVVFVSCGFMRSNLVFNENSALQLCVY